jgi:hypothetical protein
MSASPKVKGSRKGGKERGTDVPPVERSAGFALASFLFPEGH